MLVALAFEVWVYMLGFGGIEVLWQQLNFLPRTLNWLLPPLVYFYLRAQFDASFQFRLRDARHALPFVVDTLYRVVIFAQGPAFVQAWETNVHNGGIDDLEFVGGNVQQFLYLYWSFHLYRNYRQWTKTQFSDIDPISFRWFRNFLIALTFTVVANLVVNVIDLWLDLDFWHDWWGNLVTVVLIYYVSIQGYAQAQMARKLHFNPDESRVSPIMVPIDIASAQPVLMTEVSPAKALTPDLSERLTHLLMYMTDEKPYLHPDLSLTDLSRQLHTNPVLLSQLINSGAGRNFNDFVNQYRVEEFKRQVRNSANAHLSFLGLALDCGFNSKATFNRAFKKFTGLSPKEYVDA